MCLARSLLELSRVQFALIIFCRILRLRWVLSIHLVLLAKRRTVLELGRQFGVKSKYKYWRVSRSTDLSILKDNKYTWFSLEVFIVTMVTNALAVKCMHGVPHCNFEKEGGVYARGMQCNVFFWMHQTILRDRKTHLNLQNMSRTCIRSSSVALTQVKMQVFKTDMR